jgi:ABC-type transport system involved in cytochrome bd biosynthesis fused ATPase/permease subunit
MNEAVRNPGKPTPGPIIEIENLSISFFTRKGEIPAVMDFSCTVMPGEAMGIVGESGCGKSTVSLGIMRSGSGSLTARTISSALLWASSFDTLSWISGTSISCWPTFLAGLRLAIGSWFLRGLGGISFQSISLKRTQREKCPS